MREYRPTISVVYCIRALCCVAALVVLELLAAPATDTGPGVPRFPVLRLTAPPTGGVTLKWDKGVPPETTVSNLTTGAAIYAGLADAVMFSGLVLGSTNRFQASNTNTSGQMGLTPVLTTLATTQDLRCTITVHDYVVTVPVRSNQLTWVMTSTNLTTWYNLTLVLQTNPTFTFLWTNDGAVNRYFRSTSP